MFAFKVGAVKTPTVHRDVNEMLTVFNQI